MWIRGEYKTHTRSEYDPDDAEAIRSGKYGWRRKTTKVSPLKGKPGNNPDGRPPKYAPDLGRTKRVNLSMPINLWEDLRSVAALDDTLKNKGSMSEYIARAVMFYMASVQEDDEED